MCTQGTGATLDMFRDDIITQVAAKRELGLQLLLVDVCYIANNAAVPETLRYLFLSNR